jgi:hypothetical protein
MFLRTFGSRRPPTVGYINLLLYSMFVPKSHINFKMYKKVKFVLSYHQVKYIIYFIINFI